MTDATTVSPSLAALTANGWVMAQPLSGLNGEVLRKPAGFGFDWNAYFPWDIWIGKDGRAETNFDPRVFYPTAENPLFNGWTHYYLDNVAGLNANSGLTPALAKQSFSSVVTAINAGSTDAVVWVKNTGTDYIRSHGWNGGTRLTKSVCVVGYGAPGRVVMGLHDNAAWALDGTFLTTYSTTTFTTFKRGVDLANRDDLGDYTELTLAASAAEVEAVTTTGAAGGKIYSDGVKVYVKRYDGAAVSNTNTRVYRGSVEGARNPTTGDCYVWNVAFEGGNAGAFKGESNATGRVFLMNASGKWSGDSGAPVDGILARDIAFMFCWKTVAARASADGFDWTPTAGTTPHGVLIDCEGYRNGVSPSQSNNGVTSHEGSKLLILNGVFQENYGGNLAFADTGALGTQFMAIGTIIRKSLGDVVFGGTLNPANVQLFSASKGWLDHCVSDTDPNSATDRDFSVSGTSQLYHRHVNFVNGKRQATSNPSATIAEYS